MLKSRQRMAFLGDAEGLPAVRDRAGERVSHRRLRHQELRGEDVRLALEPPV
jgi:hypothetical protein